MSTWERELVSDETVHVTVKKNKVYFVRNVYIGSIKRGLNELVHCYVTKDDGKKILISSLHPENQSQESVYVCLDSNFRLSHSLKEGAVWFCYYELNQPKIQRNPEAKVFCRLCRRKFDKKEDLSNHNWEKHESKWNGGN